MLSWWIATMIKRRKSGASGFRVGGSEGFRVEVEASEVEVDRKAEALAVAVAAGLALDPLDLAVQPLREGIRDVARGGVEHAFPVLLDHARHALHGLETRTDRPAVPPPPHALGPAPLRLAPEKHRGLLTSPGP